MACSKCKKRGTNSGKIKPQRTKSKVTESEVTKLKKQLEQMGVN